jgi:hypothetical protein
MLPFWSDVDINNFDAQVTVANERLALLRKSLETVEETYSANETLNVEKAMVAAMLGCMIGVVKQQGKVCVR